MNFTYKNNLWKGPTSNSVIPTNSRPFHNHDPVFVHFPRTAYKANPIKQWRKQLNPHYKTRSSNQVSISQMEAPNTASSIQNDIDCNDTNIQLLKEYIKNEEPCVGIKVQSKGVNAQPRCVGGSANVRRSASTTLSKGYFQTQSQYLKAKCKTYHQNSILGKKTDNEKYHSAVCSSEHTKCKKPVVYKPSNSSFQTQGSVSSSSYILRKKNNAMTNNSASLKNAYGSTYVHKKPYYVNQTGYDIQFIKGSNEPKTCC